MMAEINDLPHNWSDDCQLCHRTAVDCICPECPVCGEHGNPKCVENHGYDFRAACRSAAVYLESVGDESVDALAEAANLRAAIAKARGDDNG